MMQISRRYTHITSLLSLPPPPQPLYVITEQQTRLPVLYYTTASHQLSALHTRVHICRWYFLCSSHSYFLSCVHKSILYISVSIPSLHREGIIHIIFLNSIYMY